MKSFDNLKGSCGCKKVNYEIKDKPLITQACHCKDCKKSTGSSFVIHTMVFEDDFSIIGDISSTELPTGSGKGCRAYFCWRISRIYIYYYILGYYLAQFIRKAISAICKSWI